MFILACNSSTRTKKKRMLRVEAEGEVAKARRQRVENKR
jgi:hypothetical protein